MRASWLATCLSWSGELTSPSAHTPSAEVRWNSSTTTRPVEATSTPADARPRRSELGVRPVATSNVSAVSTDPSLSVTWTSDSVPDTAVTVVSSRTSQRLRARAVNRAPISSSRRVSSSGRRQTMVTSVPSALKMCANSAEM